MSDSVITLVQPGSLESPREKDAPVNTAHQEGSTLFEAGSPVPLMLVLRLGTAKEVREWRPGEKSPRYEVKHINGYEISPIIGAAAYFSNGRSKHKVVVEQEAITWAADSGLITRLYNNDNSMEVVRCLALNSDMAPKIKTTMMRALKIDEATLVEQLFQRDPLCMELTSGIMFSLVAKRNRLLSDPSVIVRPPAQPQV